jgi:hypothetical protein
MGWVSHANCLVVSVMVWHVKDEVGPMRESVATEDVDVGSQDNFWDDPGSRPIGAALERCNGG